MSRWLVKHDGLFLGSSSACNLVAAVRVARRLGRNSKKTIVTILWVADSCKVRIPTVCRCDSGARHYSKVNTHHWVSPYELIILQFWNDDYLRNASVTIDPTIVETMLCE
jgi:cysteine synthase A